MEPHGADRRWTARGRPRGSRDCASGFARSFTTHRSKPRDSNPEARTCITPRRTTRRTGSARAHPEHWTPCSGGKQPQPPRWANRADLRIRRPVTTTRVKERTTGARITATRSQSRRLCPRRQQGEPGEREGSRVQSGVAGRDGGRGQRRGRIRRGRDVTARTRTGKETTGEDIEKRCGRHAGR